MILKIDFNLQTCALVSLINMRAHARTHTHVKLNCKSLQSSRWKQIWIWPLKSSTINLKNNIIKNNFNEAPPYSPHPSRCAGTTVLLCIYLRSFAKGGHTWVLFSLSRGQLSSESNSKWWGWGLNFCIWKMLSVSIECICPPKMSFVSLPLAITHGNWKISLRCSLSWLSKLTKDAEPTS